MGGHFWADHGGAVQSAIVGVEHLISDLPDGPLTAEQLHSVQESAAAAAEAVRDERTVLVRCRSGCNRSGLVVAQTPIELGQNATSAIALVRQQRSPWALNNRTFEEYLTTGLDVACLLAGLEAPA
jgi:protein-tyrosine phosphatase